MSKKIKFLAYYLPQYHPIPKNDEWWGEGFTEWTNVKKAKPLFKGHKQPVIPGELGYYDLMKTEGIQEKQAALAKEYGIDGFIYYQYWFGGGKMLLEKPAEKMLVNKNVNLPFCFCWANETWSGIWHGAPQNILIEQKYLGLKDEEDYFNYNLKFFNDSRYIKIDGKPMYIIYDVLSIPDLKNFLIRLRALAEKSGLKGLYIVASNRNPDDSIDFKEVGFDAKISYSFNEVFESSRREVLNNFWFNFNKNIFKIMGLSKKPMIRLDFKNLYNKIKFRKLNIDTFPLILPNWDNSPRSGFNAVVIENSKPEIFEKQILNAQDFILDSNNYHHFIIVKSWNEWAEGNYLEPDSKIGCKYLEKIKKFKST